MRSSHGLLAVLAAAGLVVSTAQAQSIPEVGNAGNAMSGMSGMPGMGNMTAAGGLMGGMLPNLSSASTGNVAGVLSYCVQNNYLSGNGPTSVLRSLTRQQSVTSSSDYIAGHRGQLITGGSTPFSLSSLKGTLKQKACSMILDRAQKLL